MSAKQDLINLVDKTNCLIEIETLEIGWDIIIDLPPGMNGGENHSLFIRYYTNNDGAMYKDAHAELLLELEHMQPCTAENCVCWDDETGCTHRQATI